MKQLFLKRLGAAAMCIGFVFPVVGQAAKQEIGDSASSWFALQASGKAAAAGEPMPGVQASAAYARYLKSFEQDIPERFGSSVKDNLVRQSN